MQIPKEQLRQGRIEALQKVKKERRRKKQVTSAATAAALILCFFLSIRVSPTVASYAAKIPGLQIIVELIQENEGIKDAIDHEYYEEIGVMASKNGYTITLQGAIVDSYGMMLAYELLTINESLDKEVDKTQLFQDGKELVGSYSSGSRSYEDSMQSNDRLYDLLLTEPEISESPNFIVKFTMPDGTEIDIPFTLNKPIAQEKTIAPNETITIDGQSFTITKIRRTPLRIAIEVEPDPTNTMQILELENLQIGIKNKSKRELIKNGIVSHGSFREGKVTYYLQSNYFNESDELTLRISEVHAVPKGEDFILVDFANDEVVYVPDYIDWPMEVKDNMLSYYAPVENNHGNEHFFPGERSDGTSLVRSTGSFYPLGVDENGFNYRDTYESYDGIAKLYVHYFDNPIASDIELTFKLE